VTERSSTPRVSLADELHGMGDAAYSRACELARRDLCLGEEHKIKTGAFALENLKALEQVRAEFGRANGLWEAAKVARAQLSETTAADADCLKTKCADPETCGESGECHRRVFSKVPDGFILVPAKPVAWRREWDGDDSDLGMWIYEEEREPDGYIWQALYAVEPE
jgi:hypothetical protein